MTKCKNLKPCCLLFVALSSFISGCNSPQIVVNSDYSRVFHAREIKSLTGCWLLTIKRSDEESVQYFVSITEEDSDYVLWFDDFYIDGKIAKIRGAVFEYDDELFVSIPLDENMNSECDRCFTLLQMEEKLGGFSFQTLDGDGFEKLSSCDDFSVFNRSSLRVVIGNEDVVMDFLSILFRNGNSNNVASLEAIEGAKQGVVP